MKKYLPIILFFSGALVLAGVFLFIKGREKHEEKDIEETGVELPIEKRPIASLTPSEDGHWLTLRIEKIVVDADSLDYELLYKVADGRTQGVPGTILLNGQIEVERELLLGSESSGRFRYDEGVETGTLTLRFRDEKGKLLAKMASDFKLISQETILKSSDGIFSFELDKRHRSAFFVVMQTFGLPEGYPEGVVEGPYGVFTSVDMDLSGKVFLGSGNIYKWNLIKWERLENNSSDTLGIFVEASG